MALSIFVAKLLAVLYISAGIAAVSGKMCVIGAVSRGARSTDTCVVCPCVFVTL